MNDNNTEIYGNKIGKENSDHGIPQLLFHGPDYKWDEEEANQRDAQQLLQVQLSQVSYTINHNMLWSF